VTRDGEPGRVYSAIQDRADGEAFVKRGREDRHQFRLIVAPEDGVELGDLRDFTRSLMDQMERDLETRLDWVAVDHHNTGHPHSHVVVRGVTEDGKILNIAGDYIAHGIRARASEIVTLELGPQTEWEVQQKLGQEVGQDRFTRLDRTLLKEVNHEGLIDLRPGAEQSYLGRANRYLLIDRLKKLERMDLAHEVETGRWSLSSGMEETLRHLGERREIVAIMHRAFERQGVARSLEHYVVHREEVTAPIVGRVVGKGLAGDELTERKYLVIDGIDGRAHYVEIAEPDQLDGVRRGGIVQVAPPPKGPRAVDRTIGAMARDNFGLYQPREHLIEAQRTIRVPHDDYDGYVEAHVRRLEALRRAGIVERINADNWIIPEDFEQRAADYDAKRSRSLTVRVLSAFDLEAQISSDGATWLDRQLIARDRVQPVESGFGQDVIDARRRRLQVLIDQGFAERADDSRVRYRRDLLAALERREVTRVGRELAEERGLTFRPIEDGTRIYGTFKETLQLASGKFALIEHAHEFTLVPWRPVIERERGRAIAGLVRGSDISWEFGRKRAQPRNQHVMRANASRSVVWLGKATSLIFRCATRSIKRKFGAGHNAISEAPISGLPLDRHFREHRFVLIDVVVDDDISFRGVQPVQPAGVLSQDSAPGDRHCQKQRVESRIIKPFAEIAARSHQDPFLTGRNRRQSFRCRPRLRSAHATTKNDNIPCELR
jgi:type IV secretory pathway VirD2 relaxase